LEAVLGKEDAQFAARLWGVDEVGNFEEASILHRPETLADLALDLDLGIDQIRQRRDTLAETLRVAREQREHPLRDEKILTGWNGMMITAFAEAAVAFTDESYAKFRDSVSVDAKQVDYAWLAEAMLALYDLDGNRLWLQRAAELTRKMLALFRDDEAGGLYMGEPIVSGAVLAVRPKDLFDASTPSGNAVAFRVLSRLYVRTGESQFEDEARQLIDAFSTRLTERSGGLSYLLAGLAESLEGETGSLQYASRGIVRAQAMYGEDRVRVVIQLADGWHINSQEPLQDYLIATEIAAMDGEALKDVQFPDPVERILGFQSEALSLFEGKIELSAAWPDSTQQSAIPSLKNVQLTLQACNEKTCLAPETLVLSVSSSAR